MEQESHDKKEEPKKEIIIWDFSFGMNGESDNRIAHLRERLATKRNRKRNKPWFR